MSIRLCSLVLVLGAVLVVGCESGPGAPSGPSALSSPPDSVAATPAGRSVQPAAAPDVTHTVTMMDACDPETFNAAVGEGTCTRSGGVRFERFLEELGRHGFIGAWRFAPPNVSMQVGQVLAAVNRGGEVHTFTEVEEFGGGIVPDLNELTGQTTVAPECMQLQGEDFIPPGGSTSEEEDEAGVEKYQCCIHPWMRAEVRIAEK
jgi:plastocyanin